MEDNYFRILELPEYSEEFYFAGYGTHYYPAIQCTLHAREFSSLLKILKKRISECEKRLKKYTKDEPIRVLIKRVDTILRFDLGSTKPISLKNDYITLLFIVTTNKPLAVLENRYPHPNSKKISRALGRFVSQVLREETSSSRVNYLKRKN